MRTYHVLTTILTCVAASACTTGEVKEIEISHHRSACQTLGPPEPCMTGPNGSPDLGGIAEFGHVWGHEYVLRIEKTSSDRIELLEVVSDELVDDTTTFDYPVIRWLEDGRLNATLELGGSYDGLMLDGTEFVCATDVVCDDLAAALAGASQNAFHVTFGYSPGTMLPLIARQVN